MKLSRIVTKIVIRVFFILLLVALVPYFTGDQHKLEAYILYFSSQLGNDIPRNSDRRVYHFADDMRGKKYREEDLNWLLVVNTIVLMAYGIAIYIRVYHMMV